MSRPPLSSHSPQLGTSQTPGTSQTSYEESVTSSMSSISIVDDSRKDPDFIIKEKATPKPRKLDLTNERIVSVLDKCLISTRCAVHLIVAILDALNLNPKNFKISFSTILKRRTKYRESTSDRVKETFKVPRGSIVHFDGKLMSSITGKETVDRLAVKVTYGDDIDQLVG